MTGSMSRDLVVIGLRQALPYIRMYRGRTFVVKVGGAIMADRTAMRELAGQLSVLWELGIRVVLVHGGGPQTTALSHKLGLQPTFDGGRRITDAATLEATVMSLNGTVNTMVLAACRAAGLIAAGVSGLDANLIRATRRPPQVSEKNGETTTVDFGLVGDIEAVDPAVLNVLIDGGILPVVSPLSADENGQLLNINADTVAAQIAAEMGAEKLIFITDTPGLLTDRGDVASLVSYIDIAGLDDMVNSGVISDGMLPKVKAANRALRVGVSRVHLVGFRTPAGLLLEIFTNEGSGTLIVKDKRDLKSAANPPAHAAAGADLPT